MHFSYFKISRKLKKKQQNNFIHVLLAKKTSDLKFYLTNL